MLYLVFPLWHCVYPCDFSVKLNHFLTNSAPALYLLYTNSMPASYLSQVTLIPKMSD